MRGWPWYTVPFSLLGNWQETHRLRRLWLALKKEPRSWPCVIAEQDLSFDMPPNLRFEPFLLAWVSDLLVLHCRKVSSGLLVSCIYPCSRFKQ